MGNHQAYGQDLTQKYKLIDDELEFKVYASPQGQEYQKYIVMHDGTDHFEKKYEFRVENKHNDLVNVIYAGAVPGIMVCTGWSKYQVVTERIPYRLSSLSAIQPKNSFVILSAALRGFKDLYKQHGAIGIKQTMIGINRESRVKVWLNSNFSINKPEELDNENNKQEQEKHLLQNLFNMISLKTESDPLWRTFIDFTNQQNPKTFDEFLETIQRFSVNNRINIGNTVINIFNKSYYQQKANQLIQPIQPVQPINNNQRVGVNTYPSTVPQMRRPFEQIQSKFTSNNRIEQPKPIIQNKRTESIMIQQTTNKHFPLSHQNLQPKFINTYVTSSKPIHITFNKQNTFSAIPIFTTNQSKEIVPFSHKPQIVVQTRPHIFSDFNQIKTTQSNYSLAINPSNNQLTSNSITEVSKDIIIELQKQQPKQPKHQELQINEVLEYKEKIIDGQFQSQKQQIILQGGQQYQINIRQVSSQQSFHQQLAPLIEHQPQNEAIQIIQTRQTYGLPNIEQIKSQLNPSLVKTQEIKHHNHEEGTSLQKIVYLKEARVQQNTKSKFSKNLTYRQMRRLLLEHLQN